MGVVKSKYWRKKKSLREESPKSSDALAPRSTPHEASDKTIVEQVLSHENYVRRDSGEISQDTFQTQHDEKSSFRPETVQRSKTVQNITYEEEDLIQPEQIEVMEEMLEPAEKIDVVDHDDDPYEIVTNILRIFTSTHNLIYELHSSEFPVGSPAYIDTIVKCGNDLSDSLKNMRDERKLEMWIWPLQPWQTSLVYSRSKSLVKDHAQIKNSLDEYIASHASNLDAKNALKDDLKFFLNDLQMLYYCFDLATPEIISAQIESLSYYMKSVIEATMSKDLEAYDIISRICTIESIKLGRICCSKGILQYNVGVQKELNDLAFTIVRAVKALIVIGRTIVQDETNANAKKNMVTLATGLIKHLERVCSLASNQEQSNNFAFTMEVVDLCMSQYDTAVKELVEAILKYKASSSADHLIIGFIQQLSGEIKILQATFMSTYSKTMMISILRISKCVEAICAHVYLRLTPESDPVMRDMLMNGMYAILHYCMQISLAACAKALQHNIIPPEITMLSSIRSMFITLSVILVNACPLVLDSGCPIDTNVKIAYEQATDPVIERALIDIIHYGRELILRQNPIIVVQYDESKELDDAFKIMEDELFIKEEDVDVFDMDTVETKRPISVMLSPPSYMKKNQYPDNTKIKTYKPHSNNEDHLLKSLHKNPNPLLIQKSRSDMDVRYIETEPSTPVHKRTQNSKLQPEPKVEPTKTEPVKSNNKVPTPLPTVTPLTTIPADEIHEGNLPDDYPAPPPVPVYKEGGTSEEYKEFMILRYEREQWENQLIVYKRKLKEYQQSAGSM